VVRGYVDFALRALTLGRDHQSFPRELLGQFECLLAKPWLFVLESRQDVVRVQRFQAGQGVERVFPYHSPRIEKLEVVSHGRVRRARLYYLRELQGKAARLRVARDATPSQRPPTPSEPPPDSSQS